MVSLDKGPTQLPASWPVAMCGWDEWHIQFLTCCRPGNAGLLDLERQTHSLPFSPLSLLGSQIEFCFKVHCSLDLKLREQAHTLMRVNHAGWS